MKRELKKIQLFSAICILIVVLLCSCSDNKQETTNTNVTTTNEQSSSTLSDTQTSSQITESEYTSTTITDELSMDVFQTTATDNSIEPDTTDISVEPGTTDDTVIPETTDEPSVTETSTVPDTTTDEPVTTTKPVTTTEPVTTEPAITTKPADPEPPKVTHQLNNNMLEPSQILGYIGIPDLYLEESNPNREIYVPEAIRNSIIVSCGVLKSRREYYDKEALENANYSNYSGNDRIYAYWMEKMLRHYSLYYKDFLDKDSTEKVTKADFAMCLTEFFIDRHFFGGREPIGSTPLNEQYVSHLSEKQKKVLSKAVWLGLIDNSNELISTEPLTQKAMEDMIYKFALKFPEFALQNASVNYGKIEGYSYLISDKSQLPKNANIYPYVLDNAPKEIYEIESPVMQYPSNGANALNPYEVFNKYPFLLEEGFSRISEFLNYVINVDYRTIDTDEFLEEVDTYIYGFNQGSTSQADRKKVENYVNYVKENKIILSGKAIVLSPIVFKYDFYFFVRVRIDLKVISSETDRDLIFYGSNLKYNGDKMQVYIDLPMLPGSDKSFHMANNMNIFSLIVKGEKFIERVTE